MAVPSELKSGELIVADAIVAKTVESGVMVMSPEVVNWKACPMLIWKPWIVSVSAPLGEVPSKFPKL